MITLDDVGNYCDLLKPADAADPNPELDMDSGEITLARVNDQLHSALGQGNLAGAKYLSHLAQITLATIAS